MMMLFDKRNQESALCGDSWFLLSLRIERSDSVNEQTDISVRNVITITSQCGSDGHKIAAKLAAILDWQLIDYAIVTQTAQAIAMTEEEAMFYDEHKYSLLDRILLSLQFSVPEAVEAWSRQCAVPLWPLRQQRLYHEMLPCIVERIARAGNVVIVGHGAQVLLAHQPNVFHIRVTAPFTRRVQRVMQSEQCDIEQAREHVRKKDRSQAYYLWSQFRRDIDAPLLYNLVINNDTAALDDQVAFIYRVFTQSASAAYSLDDSRGLSLALENQESYLLDSRPVGQ